MSSRTVCPTTGLAIDGARSVERKPATERHPDRRDRRPGRTPARTTSSPAEIVGTVIDRKYFVRRILGEGGMGTVYEAEHRTTGRLVAVKVMKPEHAQKPESVARLQQEARIVGQLRHPNICEIIDISQLSDGTPYLVMELLVGETLARRLERRGPLHAPAMVQVAIQVLAALEAAHSRGVIHRDMKPDNIFLIERDGGLHAKILDFGISKATGPDELPHHLTRTGMVMGTPYYMAPEQAMGERQLDGRVDVWGVGVLMYECLTGTRPFVAKNYNALLVQILTVNPQPVDRLSPTVPASLSLVVRHALEKKRAVRYQSAEQLRRALEGLRIQPSTPGREVRSFGATGLPRVPVFGSEDSSAVTSDEEPTQQITRLEEYEDETPVFADGEKTEVDDPPSFQDTDSTTVSKRGR